MLRCAGSYQDKPDILEYILDRGADTDIMIPIKNHPHHTALHLAALLGHCGIVKVLIENGADVNAVNAVRLLPCVLSSEVRHCQDGVTPLAMNELYEQQFGITVERRQKEIIAGKKTIKEDLTAAGAVMNVAVSDQLCVLDVNCVCWVSTVCAGCQGLGEEGRRSP